MRPDTHLVLVAHTGDRKSFDRVCKNVEIRIGGVIVLQHIFVVADASCSLVLGQPFSYAS